MSGKPVIVLVHGAWHSGKCFDAVTERLSKLGYDTATPELPTSGGALDKTYESDVAAVRSVVSDFVDQGRDVVVVLHSYGGVPGTDALEGLAKSDRAKNGKSGGVVALVYLTAWILGVGQTLIDINKDPAAMEPPASTEPQEPPSQIMPADPITLFYNDLPADEAQRWASELKHQSVQVFAASLKYPAYKHIPTTYLMCEADNAIKPEAQLKGIERIGPDVTVEKCSAGHSPFLSQPDVVVDVITKAAERTA